MVVSFKHPSICFVATILFQNYSESWNWQRNSQWYQESVDFKICPEKKLFKGQNLFWFITSQILQRSYLNVVREKEYLSLAMFKCLKSL